ncbi:MAG: class I SAM-dependent methyltransferase [Nitrospinaceae bacterium]|nr:class I SAM-dependent methyltransferase [Nitrospinaceae bacterium]MBT3820026.1 class I SAM-dependent methyltransferase [Nitrospinaceae bacterium]MBT4093172.1 class I SAM-dependent methyltransferase [Nitrospinaceae bacterium]MBT4431400.1 class I SAM-dependent methyltransferase [Nitrospinaceae bacterium]MBT5369516.1 class I SAM-dependent methyltransferase [Nitrospinaceae bacterium]
MNVVEEKAALDAQQFHWELMFSKNREMFGAAPSRAAIEAVKIFRRNNCRKILELGSGQGRDTFNFAHSGFNVTAMDYSETASKAIRSRAGALGVAHAVRAICRDVRQPMPFDDASFDACFSHMLFCMALRDEEIERIAAEVCRVLRPGGIHVYTVRHTGDAHYKAGVHHGEDIYEMGKFIVHFFSRKKVQDLAGGYEVLEIDEFEEGALPRKLFRVTMQKKD